MLVSYAGQEDASVMDLSTHPRRIYVVVRLLHTAGDFEVVNVKSVPYQSVSPLVVLRRCKVEISV